MLLNKASDLADDLVRFGRFVQLGRQRQAMSHD